MRTVVLAWILWLAAIGCCWGGLQPASEPLPFEEARRYCEADGGHLWLPHGTAEDSADYLSESNSSWVDLRIVPTFWHWTLGGTLSPVYDQGCYTNLVRNSTSYKTIKKDENCSRFCHLKGFRFFGLQYLGQWMWDCVCTQAPDVSQSSPESECAQDCPNNAMSLCGSDRETYRVFSTTAPHTRMPFWNAHRLNDTTALRCACVEAMDQQSYLVASDCSDEMDSVCGNKAYRTPRNWFQAQLHCESVNARLFALNRTDDELPDVARGSCFWVGLKAWTWDSRSIDFTESGVCDSCWADKQPNPAQGHCVMVTRRGLWTSTDCATSLPFLCESDIHSITGQAPETTVGGIVLSYDVLLSIVVAAPLALFSLTVAIAFMCWRMKRQEQRPAVRKRKVMSTSSCYGMSSECGSVGARSRLSAAVNQVEHTYCEYRRGQTTMNDHATCNSVDHNGCDNFGHHNVYDEVHFVTDVKNDRTSDHIIENDLYHMQVMQQSPRVAFSSLPSAQREQLPLPGVSDKMATEQNSSRLEGHDSDATARIMLDNDLYDTSKNACTEGSCSSLPVNEGYIDMRRKSDASSNPRLVDAGGPCVSTLPCRSANKMVPTYLELNH